MPGLGAVDFDLKVNGSPLTDDVVDQITEIVLDQGLGMPAQLDLTIFGGKPGTLTYGGMALGSALDFGVVVEGESTALFTGEVTAQEASMDGGGVTLRVRAFDKAHRLTAKRSSEAFVNMKVSDIVSQVVGEAGLASQVAATSVVHEEILRMQETDLAFIRRMCALGGLTFYVDTTGKMIVEKLATLATTAGAPTALEVGNEIYGLSGRLTRSGLVANVTVQGWDPAAQRQVSSNVKATASMTDQTGRPPSPIPGATEVIAGTAREAALATEAGAREAAFRGSVDATISVEAFGDPALVVGSLMELKDAEDLDGTHRITHAVHRFGPHGYFTDAESSGLADATLLGNFSDAAQPLAVTQAGLVVGVVTNIDDPKKQGRVKVKYPWVDNDMESEWARVLHLGAGNGKGLMILPDVQDEVMVAFEHGNVDYPVVIGGTYNGRHKPAAPPQTKNTYERQSWTTPAGHLIDLVDKSAESGVTVKTSDGNITILLDEKNKNLKIDAKGATTVDVKAGGNVTVESTKDVTIKGTNVTIEAKANLKLKGSANANLEAGAMLGMKGGATAKLEASGITEVKGALVKIN